MWFNVQADGFNLREWKKSPTWLFQLFRSVVLCFSSFGVYFYSSSKLASIRVMRELVKCMWTPRPNPLLSFSGIATPRLIIRVQVKYICIFLSHSKTLCFRDSIFFMSCGHVDWVLQSKKSLVCTFSGLKNIKNKY